MLETANSQITWNIDPAHSSVEFKVKHMMVSNVRGRFGGLKGVLIQDQVEPSLSRVEASIEVSTITTGDSQRDQHLKSADFFDSAKFPDIAFASTRVQQARIEGLVMVGNLTMHGVTKEVKLAVEGPSLPTVDPWGNTRIGLSATTNINRKEFGLSWNSALESGGILVGEDVHISLDLQFIEA